MNLWDRIVTWTVLTIGKVHWKANKKNILTAEELNRIRELLIPNYYIILTHRTNHLSTFFTNLSHWILTRKWGYWSHALMNMEDEVASDKDFRLVEAVSAGVQYTPFEEVFDVQGVVILKPKFMTVDRWTAVLERAKEELGKPYDTLFKIADDQSLSCVELVRTALMADPAYELNFQNFEALIQKYKNLTPQMYADCSDFEVVYEVIHK